ncbi:uncharacterized protein LOC120129687 [Hibiscus syriacus]|uniref:uncharacterized protein LOC120129687 n=1 Tax=Hibiscus syriacus TaxID=106335 RepID=UPI0019218978|nr:uncharacterized protein LOC120129687 [Hibiscus syriacus]
MRAYVIENVDFWQMSIPTNVNWSFKYILRIRPTVLHLFSGPIQSLSIRSIWDDMHISTPKVSWQHLVWFPGRIPKHNIIVWMSILNRLPTRVRLLRMGLNIENDKCLMCGVVAECRDHLFFGCNFTKDLWGAILALCGLYRGVSGWDSELAWAIYCLKGKSLIVRIFRLAWAGHVYSIWTERNSRPYGGRARPVD